MRVGSARAKHRSASNWETSWARLGLIMGFIYAYTRIFEFKRNITMGKSYRHSEECHIVVMTQRPLKAVRTPLEEVLLGVPVARSGSSV